VQRRLSRLIEVPFRERTSCISSGARWRHLGNTSELGGAVDGPHAGVERPADGHVAVDGDEQHVPDGHRLSDRRDRPHVLLGVREVLAQRGREPVGQVVRRVERLDEQARDQVERVDAREGSQQPVGGVGAPLPYSGGP